MSAARARIEKSPNAFRSIGEAAAELGLETHVLRYWESKFPREVRPIKRKDGRRMFRPQDIDALRAIQMLVHEQGMTLKGARALLQDQGIEVVLAGEATLGMPNVESPARQLQNSVAQAFGGQIPPVQNPERRARLQGTLVELTDLKARIDAVRERKVA